MKYIKLFENFNEEPYLEDAKWIILSHIGEVKEIEIDPKWNTKNLLKFELSETPSQDKINKCKEHLKEEGFFLSYSSNSTGPWESSDPNYFYTTGLGTLEDWCINWLNDNYGNLNIEKKNGQIYYIDKDRNIIIEYMESLSGYFYINYTKVWSFFVNIINIKSYEIKPIISKWLKDKYNLSNLAPESGIMTTLP